MGAVHFSYRALLADGSVGTGQIEAIDAQTAAVNLRLSGARPISIAPVAATGPARPQRPSRKIRVAAATLIGELAVLINAGLPLDRSLALAIGNVEDKAIVALFTEMLTEIRAGSTLSQAMLKRQGTFPPAAAAMAEAGEANGALGAALARLADMLERAEGLRRLVTSSMIYPASLGVVAIGVILLMLLFVVPQFESLFAQANGKLPAASVAVMAASRFVRDWGWWLAAGIAGAAVLLRQAAARPGVRRTTDKLILGVPQLGTLVRSIETARFARTLGVLVEGNVPLPHALALARRTVANQHIGAAIARVAEGVREGSGLAAPLAAANVLPKMAIGFLRTGEEISQLGPMLARLADVLDRDIAVRLQRLIGVLTPAITIVLGASVAAIIAAVMSAIIGFNDLAISQ